MIFLIDDELIIQLSFLLKDDHMVDKSRSLFTVLNDRLPQIRKHFKKFEVDNEEFLENLNVTHSSEMNRLKDETQYIKAQHENIAKDGNEIQEYHLLGCAICSLKNWDLATSNSNLEKFGRQILEQKVYSLQDLALLLVKHDIISAQELINHAQNIPENLLSKHKLVQLIRKLST